MNKKSLKGEILDIVLIAILTSILFVQEELLSFLPNIQLTVFLILLYSKKLGFIKTTIIVVFHVTLDNLALGSFNLIYTPFMLIGWMMIPIITTIFLKKIENPFILGLFGILFSLIYSWIYILPTCLMMKVKFIAYLIADLPFEGLLALSSFLSILLLYKPLSIVFDRYYKYYQKEESI